MKKVFLGGTCNESKWRDELISKLNIDYFNPVVKDWTEECMAEEIKQRDICDYCLYVITPLMTGVYSIAEVIDDSNKREEGKTIFCVLDSEFMGDNLYFMNEEEYEYNKYKKFTKQQLKSLNQVGKMVERNDGKYFKSLDEVAEYLNG